METSPKAYSLVSFKKQVIKEKRKAYSFKEDHKVAPYIHLCSGISFMDVVLYATYSKDMINTYLDAANPLPKVLERDRERVLYVCDRFNSVPFLLTYYMEELLQKRIEYFRKRGICSSMVDSLTALLRKVKLHRLHRSSTYDDSSLIKFQRNIQVL